MTGQLQVQGAVLEQAVEVLLYPVLISRGSQGSYSLEGRQELNVNAFVFTYAYVYASI